MDVLGDGGADSAGKAAVAQQNEARRQYNEISGIAERATVSSLANYDKDIARQEKNLSRQEQLIAQIDPTIIEASQQALKLLRGEQSSTLAPLQSQRAAQRQKLLNSLREQLGPGAETSTAGIAALSKFDTETSNIMAGAQQQALGQLGQTAGQFNATRPDLFREIMGLSSFGQGKSNTLFNQANVLGQAGRPLIDTAGANFTADTLRGQRQSAINSQLFGAAVSGATAYATGGASAAAPKSGGGGSNINYSSGGSGLDRADAWEQMGSIGGQSYTNYGDMS